MSSCASDGSVVVVHDQGGMRADRWLASQLGGCPARSVRIDALLAGDSPRRSGPDRRHAEVLAELDDPLPPIIVHSPSMRVVDGAHRVAAARERGDEEIPAVIYSGEEKDAFVIAVKMNVAHGLPLVRSDRVAAAERIVLSHPEWSNRMIASISGVAAGTVGAVRQRSTGRFAQLDARVGRDGRVRPLDSAAGRELAGRLLTERPTASLRAIAHEAGVSPSTVQDVRQRLHEGLEPVPRGEDTSRVGRSVHGGGSGRRSTANGERQSVAKRRSDEIDTVAVFAALKQDPTVRYNESGRALLRLFEVNLRGMTELSRLAESVPDHLVENVARLSLCCAAVWENVALQLKKSGETSE